MKIWKIFVSWWVRRSFFRLRAVSQQGPNQGSSIRIPAHHSESQVAGKIAGFLRSEKEDGPNGHAAERTAGSKQLLRSTADTSRVLKDGTRNEISEVVKTAEIVRPQYRSIFVPNAATAEMVILLRLRQSRQRWKRNLIGAVCKPFHGSESCRPPPFE